MALVLKRRLAIPLWVIAVFAVALTAPSPSMPPVTVLLGIALLALATVAAVRWRKVARGVVQAFPVPDLDRRYAGAIMSAGIRIRMVDRVVNPSAPDDALDLVRKDDGGWQMAAGPHSTGDSHV